MARGRGAFQGVCMACVSVSVTGRQGADRAGDDPVRLGNAMIAATIWHRLRSGYTPVAMPSSGAAGIPVSPRAPVALLPGVVAIADDGPGPLQMATIAQRRTVRGGWGEAWQRRRGDVGRGGETRGRGREILLASSRSFSA
jgi:hypothetical protein